MTELPVACTLDAEEYPQRLARMASLGERALLAADDGGRVATLRFRPDSETHAELRAIVAAEAQCCAFLKMDISLAGEELVLAIEAPEGAEGVLAAIVDAFAHSLGPWGGSPRVS